MPGWVDNFNGPVGMMVGGGTGVLRISFLNADLQGDMIPCDVAIKAIIISGWKRGIVTYEFVFLT